MTKKQYRAYKYLSRLWRIDREIRDKEDELYSIGLAGIRYDKDRVQTSLTDPSGRVADIIGEIQEEREEYIRVKHRLINEIHSLEDGLYEQILVDRFINNISMYQIRLKYGYSNGACYNALRRALDSFSDKYCNKVE